MDNLFERFIKRNNKKRGFNITVATMVMFLLSCGVSYSENVEIKYENGKLTANEVESGILGKNEVGYFYMNKGIIEGQINFNGELKGEDTLVIINTGIVNSKKAVLGKEIYAPLLFDNFGIVVGEYTNINSKNNFGIHIVEDDKIKITTGDLFNGKTYGKVFFQDDRGSTFNRVLINGIEGTEGSYISKALTYDEIIEISNSQTGQDSLYNLIINVVGDKQGDKYNSLIVGNQFGIEDSYINGYKTAIKFDDTSFRNSFIGSGVIVNGGEYSFLGSNNSDKIILYRSNWMPENIINGNISLGAGNDEVNISKTKINGDIDFGTGNDSLIASDSTIKGNINFDENANITINNNVTIDGKITVKGDTTNLTLGKDVTLGGNTTFDIQSKNKNLILGYNINNKSDINSMKNQVANDKLKEFVIKLANGGNSNVNLEGIKINTSITGGSGDDVFTIGQNEIDIKISDVSASDNDILKLSFNTTEETKLSGGYENIETLQLADGGNTLNMSGLKNFTTIIGGKGNDNFTNVDKDTLGKIFGGNGIDTVTMGGELTATNDEINTVFGNSIEKLVLADGKNNLSLDDLSNVSKIDFTRGDNTVTLGSVGEKQDFMFDETTKFNGSLTLNINGNTAQIGSSTLNGDKISLNNSFISGGKLTFNNGVIKFELGKGIYFNDGVKSNYGLNLGNIALGETATLKTHSFLKVDENNTKLSVKSWEELSNGKYEGDYTDKYNEYLGMYNKDKQDELTNTFNTWTDEELADFIVNGTVHNGDLEIKDNNGTYSQQVINGTLKVDTNVGKLDDLTFNTVTAGSMNIASDNKESGNIDFKGTVTIIGGIDATEYDGDLTLNFSDIKEGEKNGINLGEVAFGSSSNNNLNINTASKVNTIGSISAEGNVNININNVGDNSDGFNKILAGANSGKNNSIEVNNSADVEITKNYGGTLTFNGTDNNITLGSTIGNLVMGDGADNINLDTSKFIGDITVNVDGGKGDDIFNIGSPVSTLENNDINQKLEGKILTGAIKDFGNINVNESINFASDLAITGTSQITIGTEKELGLNVDYSKTQDGKVIGHALYNNGITVDNANGKLVIGTADAKKDTTISMGTDNISTITNGKNIVTSGSINHEVKYDKDKNEIEVIVKDSIVDGADKIKYASLDKIHQSIKNADKIDLMKLTGDIQRGDRTEDEAIKAQLEFYGKIYTSTPYAYSNDISRETVNMVNSSIMDSRFKADEGKWLHYGAIAGQGYDDDNSYYGRGYYNSVDLGTTEVNVKSDIYAAYYMGEYGKTDKLALGYVIAGNNSNTDIGESKLDGSGYYLGTYAKYNTGNLKLIAGLGYQHNYYKADRRVSNDYQSMAVEKKYTDDTLTAYSGVRYIHNLSKDLTVEPYARLSLTHVMQHSINETDKGDLSISVDGKDFTTIESEIGVDLVKSTTVKDGKVNLIAGIGAEFMLEGYEKENLTAKINGSTSSFDIISDKEENFRGKVSLGVEYEKTNGVFYNAKGSYIRTEDSNNYKFEVGIGYRF